jgi:hypothetical protein
VSADEAAVRVTVGHKRAVLQVLANAATFASVEALAEAVAIAVLTAEDDRARRVVVTRDPGGHVYVFGPYATAATAMKVLATGALASVEGTRGAVLPLIPTPKSTTKKAASTKATAPTRK